MVPISSPNPTRIVGLTVGPATTMSAKENVYQSFTGRTWKPPAPQANVCFRPKADIRLPMKNRRYLVPGVGGALLETGGKAAPSDHWIARSHSRQLRPDAARERARR